MDRLVYRRRAPTWSSGALYLLLLLTIGHSIVRWRERQREEQSAALQIGDEARMLVVTRTDPVPIPLSRIEAGKCRYVVVSALDHRTHDIGQVWMVESAWETGQALMPHEWASFWVLLHSPDGLHFDKTEGGLHEAFSMFGADFPVDIYFGADSSQFRRAVGIARNPSYVVLDRDGRLVARGQGGTLWSRNAYRPDCRLEIAPMLSR